MNAEPQREIRTESAAALMHRFGVKGTTAWRWRTWLKVEAQTATRGSRGLHAIKSAKGAAAIKTKDWTDEERDSKSATAKRLGLRPGNRWAETGWTPAELALLGTDTDEAVAARIGRSRSAVRSHRVRPGIPPPAGG